MRAHRLLALVLIAVILVSSFSLTSCDRRYDETEVVAAAAELLPKAVAMNTVYYGRGIATISTGYQNGSYHEADPVHLRELGFTTIDGLKSRTAEVFSSRYTNTLFNNILAPLYVGDEIYRTSRYYQEWEDDLGAVPRNIMVNTQYEAVFDDRMEYILSDISAVCSEGDVVHMTVGAIVKNEEGKTQRTTVKFSLYEEKDGWRIDNPCFANYNKLLDK